jgi:hypothetical protein
MTCISTPPCTQRREILVTLVTKMLRTVVASAVVASAAAFSAPSAFMGKGLSTQVNTVCCFLGVCSMLGVHIRCSYQTVAAAFLCLDTMCLAAAADGGCSGWRLQAWTIEATI